MGNKIVSFLRESKIGEYTNIMSDDDVLNHLLSNSSVRNPARQKATEALKKFNNQEDDGNIKKEDNVLMAISDVLQSITKEAVTTSEMLEIIHQNYTSDVIDHVSDFIKIVHARNYKIVTNAESGDSKDLKDTKFCIKKVIPKRNAESKSKKWMHASEYGLLGDKKIEELKKSTDPKTGNPNYFEIFNTEEMCFAKTAATNIDGKLENVFLVNDTGSDDKIKAEKLNPSLAYILVDSPDLRIGTRNSLELSTFFNTLSTIELSKCQPYFNATFILPNIVKNESGTIYKTASITQFLEGTPTSTQFETDIHKTIEASFNRSVGAGEKKFDVLSVNTNISAFTMPQTINNFNEYYVGHNQNIRPHSDLRNTRATSIHDITRPFMTIKSFSVDVAPTQGLMSFKSGKLSLVLHDRTRMIDIAPFIKPDLFGSYGSEIAIEYGWSHTDAMSTDGVTVGKNNNYLAEFLNSSRVTEKYIITNSSFNMDANGQVNIDLSIAMRGPVDIRSVLLKSDPPKEIAKTAANTAKIALGNALSTIAEDSGYPANGIMVIDNVTGGVVTEILSITDTKSKNKPKLANNFVAKYKKFKSNLKKAKSFNQLQYYLYTDFTKLGVSNPIEIKRNEGNELTTYTSNENAPAYEGDELKRFNVFKSKLNLALKNFVDELNGKVLSEINKSSKAQKELIAKIIGGLDEYDPFYNKEWLKLFYEINLGQKNVEKNGLPIKGIGGIGGTSYVSFGSFLIGLIGTHLTNTGKFDEIQIVSYTANEFCGLMSNLNIASFLIPRDELEEFLNDIFNAGVSLTLESVISQVIERFIHTRLQICYGIKNLYKRDAAKNTVAKSEKASIQKKSVNNQLRKIYIGLAKDTGVTEDSTAKESSIKQEEFNDVRFVLPKIKFTFDTITSKKSNYEKTISRISIFDQNDNPFGSINTIMKDVYDNGAITVAAQLNKLRAEYNSKAKSGQKKVKKAFYQKSYSLIESLIKRKLLTETGSKGVYTLSSGFQFDVLKSNFKNIMPSITYGTQNSAIIEASVSTVNEAKLNTIYLTRSERSADGKKQKKQQAVKVNFEKDLPLRVLPTQAQVTLFGCPFVNFAQYIFLDFETGTTIDNSYAVTGIKHDLTPGKFTTQLTLSYGDVYGKYKNAADTIAREISMLEKPLVISESTNPKEANTDSFLLKEISSESLPVDLRNGINIFENNTPFKIDLFFTEEIVEKLNAEKLEYNNNISLVFNIKKYFWKDHMVTLSKIKENKNDMSGELDVNILLSDKIKGKVIDVKVNIFSQAKNFKFIKESEVLNPITYLSNIKNFAEKQKDFENVLGRLLKFSYFSDAIDKPSLLLELNSNLVKDDLIENLIQDNLALNLDMSIEYEDVENVNVQKPPEFSLDIDYRDGKKLKKTFDKHKLDKKEILKNAVFNTQYIQANFKGNKRIFKLRKKNEQLRSLDFIKRYEFTLDGLELDILISHKSKRKEKIKTYKLTYKQLIDNYFLNMGVKIPKINQVEL